MNTPKPRLLLATLLSFSCLAAAGTAQNEERNPPNPDITTEEGDDGRRFEARPEGVVEVVEGGKGVRTERILDPEEARMMREEGRLGRMDGSHLFNATVMFRPRRLAPGQTGEMFVVVTLTDASQAVVLPGSSSKAAVEIGKLPLTGGELVLQPALRGEQPSKFRGKLVYDENLVFRAPVTLAAQAKFGKFPVAGMVELELTHSRSGEALGKFHAPLNGSLWIGKPLPQPAVGRKSGQAKAQASPAAGAAGAADAPRAVAADAPAGPRDTVPAGQGAQGRIEPGAEAASDPACVEGPADELLDPPESGLSALTWVFSGLIAILAALLLLARRR